MYRLRRPRTSVFLPRVILSTALLLTLVYFLVVGIGAEAIYRHHTDNRWTKLVERIFPYPAVVINNTVIPLSRYREEVAALTVHSEKQKIVTTQADIGRLVMNQFIDRTLYQQELTNYHIQISDKDVDNSLLDFDKQIGGQDKLAAYLQENYGPTFGLAEFRLLLRDYLNQAAVQNQLLVHAEVRDIFFALPSNPTSDQVEAIRQKALGVRGKIPDAAHFADAAKQYSEDLNSRDKGGLLGTTTHGDDQPVISADFENTVFSIPVGQISQPVRSTQGWHLILVDKREGTLNESLKQLTSELRKKGKIQAFIGT